MASSRGPGGPAAFPREPEILAAVPAADRFLTVDELEASSDRMLAAAPGVRAWVCGRDAAGREMRCLEAGDAPRRALLLGHVHGEEPVGTLLLEYLLPLFATTDISRRLGFRVSAVKVCDPLAARLNEGWIRAPYDPLGYVLGAYRSAYAEQPIWSFPFARGEYVFDAPPPETRAMMAAVEAAPLDLVMSLHDCSFYGGYFYVSEADDELLAELVAGRAAAGIPVHRGEPELPYVPTVGDGILAAVTAAAEYDYLERYGDGPPRLDAGSDADEYAMGRWGAHSIMAEAPCFTSDLVADRSGAGVTRGDAKREGIALEEGHVAWLAARYDEAASLLDAAAADAPPGAGPSQARSGAAAPAGAPSGAAASPWLRAVSGYLADCAQGLPAEKEEASSAPAFAAEATVAQRFCSVYNRELLALCRVGQFARALDAVAARAPRAAALRAAAETRVRDRLAVLAPAAGLRPVPIRARVQMQLAALFASMAYVRDRRPAP